MELKILIMSSGNDIDKMNTMRRKEIKCKTTATRAGVIFLFSSLLTQVDFAVIRLEVPCKVFMRTARSIKSMVSAAALEEMRHKSN